MRAMSTERALLLSWIHAHRPQGPDRRGAARAAPPPSPEAGFLPAWRSHSLLRPQGTGHPLCVKCGLRPRGLAERCRPCRPMGTLPVRARLDLGSGRYARALASAPQWVRDIAARAAGHGLGSGAALPVRAPDRPQPAAALADTRVGRMLLGRAAAGLPDVPAGTRTAQAKRPAPQGGGCVMNGGSAVSHSDGKRRRVHGRPPDPPAGQRTLQACWGSPDGSEATHAGAQPKARAGVGQAA